MFHISGDHLHHPQIGAVGTRLAGVVQGYRPQVDWGGDSGSATIVVGKHNVKVATSGWRRRCLYILLLALLALSVMNLSLTLWILKTIYFNVEGMGHLNVEIGGLLMKGGTEFAKKMSVARIQSRENKDLSIQSYYNLTLYSQGSTEASIIEEGKKENGENMYNDTSIKTHPAYLHVNIDDVLAGSKDFSIKDNYGTEVFSASNNVTRVGADRFTVTGLEGAKFRDSMQTPQVYSKGVHELRLESNTRDLQIHSNQELRVEARNGDISGICTRSAYLIAKDGKLRFENPNIFMPTLAIEGEEKEEEISEEEAEKERRRKRTEELYKRYPQRYSRYRPTTPKPETQIPRPPNTRSRSRGRGRNRKTTTPMPPTQEEEEEGEGVVTAGEEEGIGNGNKSSVIPVEVFQVCVCPSGKLFVVQAENACVSDDTVCV